MEVPTESFIGGAPPGEEIKGEAKSYRTDKKSKICNINKETHFLDSSF